MAVALSNLQAYVGADQDEYSPLLTSCLEEATVLVAKYVGGNPVPETIRDRATLEVAADLFNRRQAPNGIMQGQYATPDGIAAGLRINRDPMSAAYDMLRPWVLPV